MKSIPSGKKMLKKRPSIEKNVKQLLIEHPSTKGDDLLLIYRYWRKHDKIRISFARFQDLFYATCPETIRRSRQKIQARENKKREAWLNKIQDGENAQIQTPHMISDYSQPTG